MGCTPRPRSGQWSPEASASASNCIFEASSYLVINNHGNLLDNFTDELIVSESQRYFIVRGTSRYLRYLR